MEARALAAHEPVIAAAVRTADDRSHRQLENLFAAGVAAGEWPPGTDPALAARLFTASLYGLMAQWHLAPGSFSCQAAAAALAASLAPRTGGGDASAPEGRQAAGRGGGTGAADATPPAACHQTGAAPPDA